LGEERLRMTDHHPIAILVSVVVLAIAWMLVVQKPSCDGSHHGTKIGGVILIEGCQ
jgi:hypothetical protein